MKAPPPTPLVMTARHSAAATAAATAPPPSRSATAGPRAAPIVRGDGAATIAEHVRPALALVVRGHGAVRRRHHLPAPRGRRRRSGGDQEEEEEGCGGGRRPFEASVCRGTVGTGELSKRNITDSGLHCASYRGKEREKDRVLAMAWGKKRSSRKDR